MAKTSGKRKPRTGLDASVAVRLGFDGPNSASLTKQAFREECDINVLMDRYQRTGILPGDPSRRAAGGFVDVSDVGSYQECLAVVAKANEAFAALPARVRERFKNDPARMVLFVEDDRNREEAVRLGLVEAPPAPPPPKEEKK